MTNLKYHKPVYILFFGIVFTTAGGVFMGWMFFSNILIKTWMVVLGMISWFFGMGLLCEASSYKKDAKGLNEVKK